MNQVLPFEAVVPLRIIGANGDKPFCSIISEGKVIYSAGSTILLENIKSQEQKILYTHTIPGETSLITHHTTIYNEHILAIALKHDHSLMHTVVIVPLNTAILSNHSDRKQQHKVHQLKYIEEYQSIQGVHFFEEGNLFGVVSTYDKFTNFFLLRTSNGVVSYRETFLNTKLLVASALLNKLSCIALLLQDHRDGTRLCLMVADELSRRFFFTLPLEQHEIIIEYTFQVSPDESCYLIALTNKGFLLFFKVNEFETIMVARIDVKIPIREEDEDELQYDTEDLLTPQSLQVTGNKIVIAYQESKVLLLLQYSVLNPSSHKRVIMRKILNNRPNLQSIHSIRISRDGCSLSALFLVNPDKPESLATKMQPQTSRAIPAVLSANFEYSQSYIKEPTCRDLDFVPRDQYIALHIDLLSNLIDHSQKHMSVSPTLSTIAGQAPVCKVEYCPHSNTIFLLLKNQALKYYNMSPMKGARGKVDYHIERLHLWTVNLGSQPVGLAVHPFNFSLLVLYSDIIKFHYYNCKTLFPAFLVTPVKHCRQAIFSPLGDKIVLANSHNYTIMDSYTFRTLNQVVLPNLLMQPSSQHILVEPKAINDFMFPSNDEMMFLSGHNTLTEALNMDKTVHFGFIETDQKIRTPMAYDPVNKLTAIALAQVILVLSKATLNSNNRCETVSKIQVAASALLQVAELGVFFIGCKDGSLIMIQWPNYSQQDLYLQGNSREYLFDEPIRSLFVTPSKTYLYAISESGSIAICQLKVEDSEKMSVEMREKLVKMAEIPLMHLEHWLVSKGDQQKKQRELIKLRGEEADLTNNVSVLSKEETNAQEKKIRYKKQQFQQTYLAAIKAYQNELGLQQLLQTISLTKDEFKSVKRQQERQKGQLYKSMNQELNDIFKERRQLQALLSQQKDQLGIEQQHVRNELNEQLKFMEEDFKEQNRAFTEKNEEDEFTEAQRKAICQMEQQEAEQLNQQCMDKMRSQFKAEWQKNVEEGQTILSQNRNTNIARYCLLDKMGDIEIKKQEMEYDLRKVTQEKQYLLDKQVELQKQLEDNSQTYHKLVKNSRELSEQLVQQRRLTSKVHHQMIELTQDVARLEEKKENVEKQYQSINSQFVQQRQHSSQCTHDLNEAQEKLQQLRRRKKQVLYRSSIAKTNLEQTSKTLQRKLETEEGQVVQHLRRTICQQKQLIKDNELGMFFDKQKKIVDTASIKAVKWIHLKQNYLGGFHRNYNKLQDEYTKLTYQYNDLFKVSQQYRRTLNYLAEQIDLVKTHPECSKKLTRAKQAQSFLHRPSKVPAIRTKPHIKQKGVCLSLHQETGKFITEVD